MFVFVIFSSVYISAFNDNRMYYVLLAFFIAPIILKYLKTEGKIKWTKIIKAIVVIAIIGVMLFLMYFFSNGIREFVDNEIYEKNIQKTIDRVTNSRTNSNGVREERIELTLYALNKGNGYGFGKGIGSILLYGDPNLPKHFGLCETSLRIYTGGLIYLILIIFMYYIFIVDCIGHGNKLLKLYIFVSLCGFALYSNVFTLFDETFLMAVLYIFLIRYSLEVKEGDNFES